ETHPRINAVAAPDDERALEHGVGPDDRPVTNLHVRADDGVRSHLHVGAQPGLRMDDCGLVNQESSLVPKANISSASAASSPSTVAFTRTLTNRPRKRVTSASRCNWSPSTTCRR